MERVHRELGDKDRSATFVSVLALAWPDGEEALFRGEVHGTLTWPPRGDTASATTRSSCWRGTAHLWRDDAEENTGSTPLTRF